MNIQPELFPELGTPFVFPRLVNEWKVGVNKVYQCLSLPQEINVEVQKLSNSACLLKGVDGCETLVFRGSSTLKKKYERAIKIESDLNDISEAVLDDASIFSWYKHPDLAKPPATGFVQTWRSHFSFKEEIREVDQTVLPENEGLRPPQVGALYATLAHWTVSSEPATVVMPTGTGKTETMLSLLACKQCPKVLVIVPTDPLREQTFKKFFEWGILKTLGVLEPAAGHPSVALLKHKPRTTEELTKLLEKSNIIVSTMSIISGCSDEIVATFVEQCSDVFIDEAHHTKAKTWNKFKEKLKHVRVLQFTATPFRNDGKYVDGKIIYRYPLSKAQVDGYFRKITFEPVLEYDHSLSDRKIAERAIEILREDIAQGTKHSLLARANTVEKAEEVYEIYKEQTDLNPVLIHNNVKKRNELLRQVREGESRIVVCVDMLGEGFDLPELKVAALHDVHKSIAVSLQFIGRFTRSSRDENIKDATFVANIADQSVEGALNSLYGEDANWNLILQEIADKAVDERVRMGDFLNGFLKLPEDLPLQNIRPKMSTVMYKTSDHWSPEKFQSYLRTNTRVKHTVNHKDNILVFVTQQAHPVSWGDLKGVADLICDLYVLHWDKQKRILFINSTASGSMHQGLAKAVCGEEAEIIKGEKVFRCLSNLKRAMMHNVGLNHALQGPLRFVMYTGLDVAKAIAFSKRSHYTKSVLFGLGYENGEKNSIGCSHKGKVWARKITTIPNWIKWCGELSTKVLNDNLSVDDIFAGVLEPKVAYQRPRAMPISIEWDELFLNEPEHRLEVHFGENQYEFLVVGIDLVSPAEEGDLKFKIYTGEELAEYCLEIYSVDIEGEKDPVSKFRYRQLSGPHLSVRKGRQHLPVTEWFENYPPLFRFVDGSSLGNNIHIVPGTAQGNRFDLDKIFPWSWPASVNIKVESQYAEKRINSIQFHLVQELLKDSSWDIIFDDDDANEIADIVAIKEEKDAILVVLYHCKFSSDEKAGARVGDFYAVCGQAQKCIHWFNDFDKMIDHMLRRNAKRIVKSGVSRIEKGSEKELRLLRDKARLKRARFETVIVQPGLAKAKVSEDILSLIGVTELFLSDTHQVPLTVICSP